jgi:hypothetical protein
MQRYRLLVVLIILATFTVVFSAPPALAATPAFTITATDVTMSSSGSSGSGSTTFTLTSINGYAGTVGLNCSPATLPAGVKVPICGGGGPALTYSLTANQVVTGIIGLINSCSPCLVRLPHRRSRGLTPGLALAGALLLRFGFRRRAARWLTIALLAVGLLAGLAGISACGGNSSGVTPGNYAYTITATDVRTSVSVTTSVNVTVP